MNEPIIRLEAVGKAFGRVVALNNVSAEIMPGEFFSLLGPSGCGKTTLLRTIAGFETPDSGRIRIDGSNMAGVEASRRPTNMVFQNYAIFPHMTVAGNVGFGLRRKRLARTESDRLVGEALSMVNLDGFQERDAHTLSGGQKQRVALARALVLRPKVLLLDEPLSALDRLLREQMQSELRNLQRAVGITFVLVTHDQGEALTMSDRIAIMFDGSIAQISTPRDLYTAPANLKVAEFIGSMNFLKASVGRTTSGGTEVEIEGLGSVLMPSNRTSPHAAGRSITAGIRPETLSIRFGSETDTENVAEGVVAAMTYFGDMTRYEVQLNGTERTVAVSVRNTPDRPVLAEGSPVGVLWDANSIVLL